MGIAGLILVVSGLLIIGVSLWRYSVRQRPLPVNDSESSPVRLEWERAASSHELAVVGRVSVTERFPALLPVEAPNELLVPTSMA